MSRNDYQKYCTIDIADALDIRGDIYGISIFVEDMVRPNTIYDTDFAEMCEIYLQMYKNKWPFVRFTPRAEDATKEVTQELRNLLSERLAEDLIDSITFITAIDGDVESDINIVKDITYIYLSIKKENSDVIELDIKIQLGNGKFDEDYKDFYKVEDIKVLLTDGSVSESFIINENSNILTDVENCVEKRFLI